MPDPMLQGLKVFFAEDEALIGIVLEDILEELGCALAGSAATLDDAMAAVAGNDPDLAILDVNLEGAPSYPLARALLERGVPVVFATGAQPDSLPSEFAACPVLEKPYAFAAVEEVLRRVASAGSVPNA